MGKPPGRTRQRLAAAGQVVGRFRATVRRTTAGRWAWRGLITVVGVAVIAVGIVLLPLPGPGWVVIFAGLGLLATEYEWARRLLAWTRRKATELANRARKSRADRKDRKGADRHETREGHESPKPRARSG